MLDAAYNVIFTTECVALAELAANSLQTGGTFVYSYSNDPDYGGYHKAGDMTHINLDKNNVGGGPNLQLTRTLIHEAWHRQHPNAGEVQSDENPLISEAEEAALRCQPN